MPARRVHPLCGATQQVCNGGGQWGTRFFGRRHARSRSRRSVARSPVPTPVARRWRSPWLPHLAWRAVKGCGGASARAGRSLGTDQSGSRIRLRSAPRAALSASFLRTPTPQATHLTDRNTPPRRSTVWGSGLAHAAARAHTSMDAWRLCTWQQCIQQPPTTAGLRPY